MGEIADALKKANAEREQASAQEAEAAPAPQAVQERVPVPPPPPRPASAPISEPVSAPDSAPTDDASLEFAAPGHDLEAVGHRDVEDSVGHLERHRHLAVRIRSELENRESNTVVVVSAMRNEGKTTVSCIIAAALASLTSTRSVALVDLDLRNPSIAARFGVDAKNGMEDVLEGRKRLDDVCIRLDKPALDFYPTCTPHRAAHELIVQPRFVETLKLLEARYSVVVIDTPPCLVVPDASLILKSRGSYVAVARSGVSRVRQFREMLALLPPDQALGKVLNHLPAPRHRSDSYYYYYGEEEEEKEKGEEAP